MMSHSAILFAATLVGCSGRQALPLDAASALPPVAPVNVADERADASPAVAAGQLPAWFEMAVIDEVGEPVRGAELVFKAEGQIRKIVTGRDGHARVEGISTRTGTFQIASMRALRTMMGWRWTDGREKEWVKPATGSAVVEVDASSRSPVVVVQTRRPLTVVILPPFRIHLLDHDSKGLPGRECTVTVASETYERVSDAGGWIEFPVGRSPPDEALVEYDEVDDGIRRHYRLEVSLKADTDDYAGTLARLKNLGYVTGDELERAVALFDLDHGIDPEEVKDGQIPPSTAAKIADRKELMDDLATVPLLIVDDLGMRKLPPTASEDLLELVMRRYERASTLFTIDQD
jgi:hypothetical protein